MLNLVSPKEYTINLTGHQKFNQTQTVKVYPWNEKKFNFNTKKIADKLNKIFEFLTDFLGADKIELKFPDIDVNFKNQWQEYGGKDIATYGHTTVWTYEGNITGKLLEMKGKVDILNVIPKYAGVKKSLTGDSLKKGWAKVLIKKLDFGIYVESALDIDYDNVGLKRDNTRLVTTTGKSEGFGKIAVKGKLLDFEAGKETSSIFYLNTKNNYGSNDWGLEYLVRFFQDSKGIGIMVDLSMPVLKTSGGLLFNIKFLGYNYKNGADIGNYHALLHLFNNSC